MMLISWREDSRQDFFNFGIVVISVYEDHGITHGNFHNDNVSVVVDMIKGSIFFFG